MLAGLGADVIRIEKPGGDPSRRIGPFYKDIPHPEKSLFWFAYNINKRGITLNIECSDGKDIFKQLVKTADFVIESYPPGFMDELGLGYQALSQLNPQAILVSITPFGQDGPYKGYKASDIVSVAMGGMIYVCGDVDRPPVRISYLQAGLHGAAEGAAGALIALYYRQRTGEGQHVDVSIQQSLIPTTTNAPVHWEMNNLILKRTGPYRAGLLAGAQARLTWPCQDGFISFTLTGGAGSIRSNRALAEWVESEGAGSDFLRKVDWDKFDMATITQDTLDKIEESLDQFFLAHTKAKLYEGALQRRIMLYPVNTFRDLASDVQLEAREFWVDAEHPELGSSIKYPGPFFKATEAQWQLCRRAPLIGEHNREIYVDELGMSGDELTLMLGRGVI